MAVGNKCPEKPNDINKEVIKRSNNVLLHL